MADTHAPPAEQKKEVKKALLEDGAATYGGDVAVAVPEERGDAAPSRAPARAPHGWESESGRDWSYMLWRVFLVLAAVSAVAGGGLIAYELFVRKTWHSSVAALYTALYCAGFSVVVTAFEIHLHLTSYTAPALQKKIIRILIMCPVYAVASWCALKWYDGASLYIGLVRDSYEAFALYTFFHLMVELLGGPKEAVKAIRATGRTSMAHPAPLCCLKEFEINRRLLKKWSACVMQFVLMKPLLAIVEIVLHAADVIKEGEEYDPTKPGVWILLLENLSVTVAFTCIFYFYLCAKDALKEHNPTGKFVAIKLVVFLCFWQGVLIGVLTHFGLIHESSSGSWSTSEVAAGCQNYLVCVEMMAICIMHKYVFPHTPYLPESGLRKPKPRMRDVFGAVIDVRDVHQDTKSFFKTIGNAVRGEDDESVTNTSINSHPRPVEGDGFATTTVH